jgi:hypothetical protein
VGRSDINHYFYPSTFLNCILTLTQCQKMILTGKLSRTHFYARHLDTSGNVFLTQEVCDGHLIRKWREASADGHIQQKLLFSCKAHEERIKNKKSHTEDSLEQGSSKLNQINITHYMFQSLDLIFANILLYLPLFFNPCIQKISESRMMV